MKNLLTVFDEMRPTATCLDQNESRLQMSPKSRTEWNLQRCPPKDREQNHHEPWSIDAADSPNDDSGTGAGDGWKKCQ